MFVACFLAFVFGSFALVPFLGRNFFPSVDGGQILMHVRAQIGTRVEEAANQFADVQKVDPRDHSAARDRSDGRQHRPVDLEHQPHVQQHRHRRRAGRRHPDRAQGRPRADRRLRQETARGAAAALPRRSRSRSRRPTSSARSSTSARPRRSTCRSAARISTRTSTTRTRSCRRSARLPASPTRASSSRARIRCSTSMSIARARSRSASPTRDVTNSMVVNLAGSSQVAPTYWLNPQNGVSYPIVMQTPQYRLDSLSALANMPINGSPARPRSRCSAASRTSRARPAMRCVSQYDIQSMVQINATTQDRDLGAVAADIRKVLADTAKQVPKGIDASRCSARCARWRARSRACCSACSARSC